MGVRAERKVLKEKMEFHPPPPPMAVKGAVPIMLSFFTTPAFFWRPVGVMKVDPLAQPQLPRTATWRRKGTAASPGKCAAPTCTKPY